jgi:2-(3-amino-3-carboxypropyl)histidine synthase
MRTLLQVPEGLKTKAVELAAKLEKEGNEIIISAEPCYGACDLKVDEAKRLGCQKIVHYGHTRFIESDFPVEYIEHREKVDVAPILEKNYGVLKAYKTIGLISSLQFLDTIPQAKAFLEGKNHKIIIGKGSSKGKKLYDGQVLGCDASSAKSIENDIDAFLFLGSGRFHPLGLSLKGNKPLFSLDFERGTVAKIDDSLFRKQRTIAVSLAKDARTFGILVSTKIGQSNIDLAKSIKRMLSANEKESFILALDEITPEKLMGIKADAWVNTACPRVAVENRADFKGPILNPDELEEAL